MPPDRDATDALPSVPGELFYVRPRTDRPHAIAYDAPAGVPRANIVDDPHTLPMQDIRPIAEALSPEREGFALVRAPTAMGDFGDEDLVRSLHYPKSERIVAEATGASRVVVFDHTIRKRLWGIKDRTAGTPRQPMARIHGDYTNSPGPERVRDMMGGEADGLPARRFAIVNL